MEKCDLQKGENLVNRNRSQNDNNNRINKQDFVNNHEKYAWLFKEKQENNNNDERN